MCTVVGGQLEVEKVVHKFFHLVDVPKDPATHRVAADYWISLGFAVSVLQVAFSTLKGATNKCTSCSVNVRCFY